LTNKFSLGIIFFGDLNSNNAKEGEIMLIHLVEAFNRTDQVIIEETFSDFVFDNGGVKYTSVDGLKCNISLKRLTRNEISIEGTSNIALVIPCDRCTKEVATDINTQFNRTINLHNEEDSAFLNGAELDLLKFLSLEILQEFPQKVLCTDECKGLCYQCGANLNNQDCTCDRGHIDIRMAHLKDLFDNKFKEV
jgi:uncharacterized protein